MTRPILSDAERSDGFRGLAHPLRRKVIRLLKTGGDMTVSQLLAKIDATPQAMSTHLAVLRETGLVSHRAAGTARVYKLNPAGLRKLSRWLDQSA